MFAARSLARRSPGRRQIVDLGLPVPLVGQSGWKLTFAEEWSSTTGLFNTNPSTRGGGFKTPNGRWNTVFGYGNGDRTLYDNAEQQWYADAGWPQDPFSLTNNGMRITARVADPAAMGGQYNPLSKPYISGLLTTDDVHRQQYGFWEVRMRTPKGKGFWPALWLMPRTHTYYAAFTSETKYTWPPEIDIMEGHGDRPSSLHWNSHSARQAEATASSGAYFYHTGPPSDRSAYVQAGAISQGFSRGADGWMFLPTDATLGFHTYGFQWNATDMRWYFDDVLFAVYPTPWDHHLPMYLIIQLAVGGTWPGSPNNETVFPAYMDIDYVRCYSQDVGATAISPPSRTIPAAAATPAKPAASAAPVATGAPTNTIAVSDYSLTYTGTTGNDQFNEASGGSPTVQGGMGDDTYVVTNTDSVRIVENPGDGNDELQLWAAQPLPANVENLTSLANYGLVLYGNAKPNFIKGGSGADDTIIGGGGDDVISLRGGNNVIVVRAGEQANLTITDFKPGRVTPRDRLLLSGYGYPSPTIVKSNLAQSGSHTILTMDNGETITLQNTTATAFNIGNFKVANVSSAGGGVADNGWIDDLTQTSEASLYPTLLGSETGYAAGSLASVGIKFKVTAAGQVTKLRCYKSHTGQTFTHLKLWNITAGGTLLASAPLPAGGEPVGWITQTLTTPVTLTANTVDYMVSYASSGRSYIPGGLNSSRTSGPIFAYGAPNNGYENSGDVLPTTPNNTNSVLSDIVFVS